MHQSLVYIYNMWLMMEQTRLVGWLLKFGGLGVPVGNEVSLCGNDFLGASWGLWKMLTNDSFSTLMCGDLFKE